MNDPKPSVPYVYPPDDPEAERYAREKPSRWYWYLRPLARLRHWWSRFLYAPNPQRVQLERQRYLVRKIAQDYVPSLEALRQDGWTFGIVCTEKEYRNHPRDWSYELRLRWWPKYDPSKLIMVTSECPGWALDAPVVLDEKLVAMETKLLHHVGLAAN